MRVIRSRPWLLTACMVLLGVIMGGLLPAQQCIVCAVGSYCCGVWTGSYCWVDEWSDCGLGYGCYGERCSLGTCGGEWENWVFDCVGKYHCLWLHQNQIHWKCYEQGECM